MTTRSLHWVRVSLAVNVKHEHNVGSCSSRVSVRLTALGAGGTPAVPVKSSSGETRVTTKGLLGFMLET
jgi:hypothetical protein